MELCRRFVARYPTRLAAYLALEVALMRRFVARGGSEEEFCRRLAPVFHRRYAALLVGQHLSIALGGIRPARPRPAAVRIPTAA
jgi:hypothetical protein